MQGSGRPQAGGRGVSKGQEASGARFATLQGPRPHTLHSALHSFAAVQRLVLRLDGWELGSQYPHGHLVRALGPINSLRRGPPPAGAAPSCPGLLRRPSLLLRLHWGQPTRMPLRCGLLNFYSCLVGCCCLIPSARCPPPTPAGARQMACWSAAACTGSPSGAGRRPCLRLRGCLPRLSAENRCQPWSCMQQSVLRRSRCMRDRLLPCILS